MSNNPFVGGPDYTRWLAATLAGGGGGVMRPSPPAGGGQQISVRVKPDRLVLLDILSKKSTWSRNQILDGLLDAALAQLFGHLSEGDIDEILSQTAARILETNRQETGVSL